MVIFMNVFYIWNRVLKKVRGSAMMNASIDRTSKVESGTTFINSTMDRYSFCGYNCKIFNCDIGSFCSIADGVIIGVAEHPVDWLSTSPVFYKGRDSVKKKFSEYERPNEKKTKIGNDVWIGEHVLIKGGITVGDGAVIGMGSVVTHDVNPYEIVAGVPAKHIRNRFSENMIKKLLEWKWWNMNDSQLEKIAAHVKNPEIVWEEIK